MLIKDRVLNNAITNYSRPTKQITEGSRDYAALILRRTTFRLLVEQWA